MVAHAIGFAIPVIDTGVRLPLEPMEFDQDDLGDPQYSRDPQHGLSQAELNYIQSHGGIHY
jgi:hypothetical protein